MAPTPESGSRGVKYREILKKNGITEPVSEVIVKDAGLVGEGFASQSLYITVKFENPKVPDLHLFAKAMTENSVHTEMLTEAKAFEKESRFFMEYVPAAKILCEEKGQGELMDIYPKCYYGDDKLVVLENLVLEKGYVLHPKEDKQGLEEVEPALLSLAKHHAISYAMVKRHGGEEGFFKTFKDFDFEQMRIPMSKTFMLPMLANSVTNNTKILEKYNVKDGNKTMEKIKSIGTDAFERILKSIEINPKDNSLLVLNHGDYHTNNMMFLKDPETQKVLNHKVIDLQIFRYNSPGVDLGYFLFTSVRQEVRRQHFEELLRFYFTNLKKVCEDLGHTLEYSYEDLFLELRKKFHMGFWFGFTLVGPGIALMKDVNINELKDLSDFAAFIDKGIQKWIQENPEKGEQVAKEIVGIIEEYYELRLD